MRRVLGALIAVAALVGAAASQRQAQESLVEKARAGAEQEASSARQRAADALGNQLRDIEARAVAAASLPQLAGQLAKVRTEGALEGALKRTLEDWFSTEPYWEPFRREFKVYGLSVEGDALELVGGMPEGELDSGAVVRDARTKGIASAVIAGGGWPHAAAAARVVVAGLPKPAVVLLARPVDEAMLRTIAQRATGAVLLSDGKKAIARAGAPNELGRLTQAVGHEAGTRSDSSEGAHAGLVAPDGAWAAAPSPLLQGVWLWTYADNGEAAREVATSSTNTTVIIWASGALIAVLALFFGFRRPATAPAATPVTSAGFGSSPVPGTAVASPPPAAPGPGAPAAPLRPTMPGPGEAALPRTSEAPLAYGSTEVFGAPQTTSRHAQFGRYTLIDKLGEGGMAQVFTAVIFGAEGFRRKFVVKRLRPELVNDGAVVAQFIDEANMASSLVHSNIIPVLDFGKVGDEYFLATEYILGRDLAKVTQQCRVVEGTSMPLQSVLFAVHETLKALEYAHTKTGERGKALGIVHRDVSPSNVLVSARGEVKLFDFGIVKAEGRVTRTQHGVVKGNVSFMSPEQARGQEVDARADLFSLGLVMFYCLTGEVLYQGETSYELLVKAATGPGPEEMARIQALPAPANGLIARALSVDPAGRYASAAEFAAAVGPHVGRGAAELNELMRRLFDDDFRKEEHRFSAAMPAVVAAPGPSSQANVRRS